MLPPAPSGLLGRARLEPMTASTTTRTLLLAILVVAAVGVLDAAIGPAWDLVVLFVLIGALATTLLLRGLGDRRPMAVRADLAAALLARSQRTGEPLDQLTDRAVATYLEALAEPDEATTR